MNLYAISQYFKISFLDIADFKILVCIDSENTRYNNAVEDTDLIETKETIIIHLGFAYCYKNYIKDANK